MFDTHSDTHTHTHILITQYKKHFQKKNSFVNVHCSLTHLSNSPRTKLVMLRKAKNYIYCVFFFIVGKNERKIDENLAEIKDELTQVDIEIRSLPTDKKSAAQERVRQAKNRILEIEKMVNPSPHFINSIPLTSHATKKKKKKKKKEHV